MNKVSDCQNCGSGEERSWILHNIRHRGIFRRFCTSCVLKFYSGSYCCVCFQVFDDLSALPNDRVFCLKCPSISHLNCVPKKDLYLCPPCSNPSFQFFNLNNNNSSKNHDGELAVAENQARRIDADLAKVLLAAAQIASISMGKAATATMLEAESRAKDAAFARKRAKESVEVLKSATFFGKGKSGKEKHKETLGGPHLLKCSSSLKEKQKKKSKTDSVVDAATAETHGSHIRINKLEESKDLSDVVDSVDKGRESLSDVTQRNATNNISGKNGERLQVENHIAMNGDTPSLLTSSESHVVKENIENNGLHSSLPDAEHLHHPPKSNHSVD